MLGQVHTFLTSLPSRNCSTRRTQGRISLPKVVLIGMYPCLQRRRKERLKRYERGDCSGILSRRRL